MKPLFGVDCTEDKKNDVLNIEQLELQRPSLSLKASLDTAMEEAEGTEERAKLPVIFRVLQWISGAGAFLIIVGIVNAFLDADGLSFEKAHENAGFLFWIAGACLLLWAVLKFLSNRKVKTVMQDDETVLLEAKLKSLESAIFQDLGVPSDAPDVDVLSYRYKMKNGEVKPCLIPTLSTAYMPTSFKVYSADDTLYFANLEFKLAVPMSDLNEIRKINKKIAVVGWIKDVSYDEEPYSQYKIKGGNGMVYYKPYYELSFTAKGETYTVQFPCYELPVMEAATGLHVVAD